MSSSNVLLLPKRLADAYFGSGTFKLLLTSSAPSESDLDSFSHRSDVPNEVSGTNYPAGGVTVSVAVGSPDATNNRVPVTLTNLTPALTSATVTAVGGWVYKSLGSAGADELCFWLDFNGSVSPSAQNLNVAFSTPFYVNR